RSLVFGLRFLRPPSLPPTVAVRPLPRPLPDVLPAAEGSKLISYRLAINRSAEEFDRLLAHDAALPSRSSVTAFRSARALPDLGSD
ncbi:MAG TPA: hypothetical protein DCE44_09905, partial [Verrucomicrobiales bacterium]|nr:hypothetical protein [Verrucomicrobiales bacterium]